MSCSKCGGVVVIRDTRKRIVIDDSGDESIFIIQRAKCKECGAVHTVLPDCIAPYKSYSKETIDGVKDGSIDWCAADDSTIFRWTHKTTPYLHTNR